MRTAKAPRHEAIKEHKNGVRKEVKKAIKNEDQEQKPMVTTSAPPTINHPDYQPA